MILLLEAVSIYSSGGIIFLKSILDELLIASPSEWSFVIVTNKKVGKHLPISSRLRTILIEKEDLAYRTIYQLFYIDKLASQQNTDLVISFSGYSLAKNYKTIHFCQNLLPFSTREILRYPISLIYFRLYILRFLQCYAFKKSSLIICPSEFTATKLRKRLPSVSNRIISIPHAISKTLISSPRKQIDITDYSEDNPYVIRYISILDHYKHHTNIVKAVAALRASTSWPLRLEFIGKPNRTILSNINNILRHHDATHTWFKYRQHVPHQEVNSFYQSSDLLLYASTCESFGLGALEAISSGNPVIVSRYSSLPEVCGNRAVYFDPLRIQSIMAILHLVIRETRLREAMVHASPQNKRNTWKESAASLIHAIRCIS